MWLKFWACIKVDDDYNWDVLVDTEIVDMLSRRAKKTDDGWKWDKIEMVDKDVRLIVRLVYEIKKNKKSNDRVDRTMEKEDGEYKASGFWLLLAHARQTLIRRSYSVWYIHDDFLHDSERCILDNTRTGYN